MRAGKLRRRVQLQQPIEGRGSNGEVSVVWNHYDWIWGGFFDSASGSDRVAADQRTALQVRQMRIRRRGDVTPKLRLVDGPNIYEILDVADSDMRDEIILTLKAVEAASR